MTDGKRLIAGILLLLISFAVLFTGLFPVKSKDSFSFQGKKNEKYLLPQIRHLSNREPVNSGNPEMIRKYSGIGETIANLVILERETNGPFFYPEDLIAVSGIGLKKLSGFRNQLLLEEN